MSSDKKFKAEIKSDMTSNYYYLTINKTDKESYFLIDSLICIKGYHDPIFNLNWKNNENILNISIDNDFGDNIQVYSFNTMTKILEKME